MADAFTAYYNLTKPEINASRDVWGDKWNGNADAIDTLLKALATAKVDASGGVFTTTPKVNADNIVTLPVMTSAIAAAVSATIPNGIIAIWKGTLGTIPSGWAVCDGTNGTPDLRDKFIAGASAAVGGTPQGSTGGAKTHDHGAFTGFYTLTTTDMPSHAHANSLSQSPHVHGINDPGHYHLHYSPGSGFFTVAAGANYNAAPAASYVATAVATTGISVDGANANIAISNAAAGGGGAHRHTIAAANNVPPFYSLFFIMKL
jgi:hypothetical protein